MTASILIEIISVLIALVAFYATQRNFSENVKRDVNKNSEQVNTRLSVLETKIELYWRNIALDQARILHMPHPEFARRDELLERLLSGEITLNELHELQEMLKAAIGGIHDSGDDGQRVAASILLRVIETTMPPEGSDKPNPLVGG